MSASHIVMQARGLSNAMVRSLPLTVPILNYVLAKFWP